MRSADEQTGHADHTRGLDLQKSCDHERERHRQRTLLELLVQTGEQYQQELACDRELFQVIALDAKGVAHSRITANQATRLLAEAAGAANASSIETKEPQDATVVKTTPRKRVAAKSATITRTATTRRPVPLRH